MPASRSKSIGSWDQGSVKDGGAGMTKAVEEMGVATRSLKTKQDADGSFRVLEGEIMSGKELQTSCVFSLLSVQYAVDMLAFDSKLLSPTPGFSSALLITRQTLVHAFFYLRLLRWLFFL